MSVEDIIGSALLKERIGIDDVVALLSAKGAEAEAVKEAARNTRDRMFGDRTFVYGFVYFSTYCRNDCAFCYYRKTNSLRRYRKSADEIVALSGSLKDAGINLVDLTMGEDPVMCADGHRTMRDVVRRVKEEVDIAVMASPGAMDETSFKPMSEAGADWFACYQETYNRDLFSKLRLEQDFDRRLSQKTWAREAGMLTEDGMMVGLGETVRDRADSILRMGALGCEQIRAMTFVPQEGTPMSGTSASTSDDELMSIAVMRLLFPDRLIPASLDVEGIAGLRTRLDAGANVITSIVPPKMNLAGVAQHELDIDNGHRSVHHVLEMLDAMGKRAATCGEYNESVSKMKSKVRIGD
ncbi:MAG: methylornithine synthase PylB [Candidatus Methanoplasma sp.]|jgi:methylornithine synthase|nr:methylornithine synthase PylB [Candidatus Methanoplasma sp.]